MPRHSIRSTESYLLVDHRFSPGLPDGFYEKIGLGHLGPRGGLSEGRKFEAPTMTCMHCGTVVLMRPERTRTRGFCRKCMGYICDNPYCNSDCKPYIKDRS